MLCHSLIDYYCPGAERAQKQIHGAVAHAALACSHMSLTWDGQWRSMVTDIFCWSGVWCHKWHFRLCEPELWASLIAQLVKNLPAMQETSVPFLDWEDPLEKNRLPTPYSWASLVTQLVKNLLPVWETWVRSLGWEDPLEKRKATLFNILAWRIPWGVAKHQTQLSDFPFPFQSELLSQLLTMGILTVS